MFRPVTRVSGSAASRLASGSLNNKNSARLACSLAAAQASLARLSPAQRRALILRSSSLASSASFSSLTSPNNNSLLALRNNSVSSSSSSYINNKPSSLVGGIGGVGVSQPRRGFLGDYHHETIHANAPVQKTDDQYRGYTDEERVWYASRWLYFLLGANGLVFLAQTVERFLRDGKSDWLDRHASLSAENLSAGRVWNLFTGLFRQTDMRGLFNLVILGDAGRLVAMEYGVVIMLGTYFLGCMAALAARRLDHSILRPRIDGKRTEERREQLPYDYEAPVSLAAGGCGALLALSLKKFSKTRMWSRSVLWPSKTIMFLVLALGFDLWDSMLRPLGGDQVSHSGYLAGGLVGFGFWGLVPAVSAPAFATAGGAVATRLVGSAPLVLAVKQQDEEGKKKEEEQKKGLPLLDGEEELC